MPESIGSASTADSIDVIVPPAKLFSALQAERGADDEPIQPILLSLPIVRVRKGHQLRLVVPGPTSLAVEPARRNPKLLALRAEAMEAAAAGVCQSRHVPECP